MFKKRSIALCALALTIMSVFAVTGTYAGLGPVISGFSPGDTVYIVTDIPNSHSETVNAWISLKNVICDENGVVEPEQDWYDLYGERNDIDSVITFGLWIDSDGDTGSCDTGAGDTWVIEEDCHVSDIKEVAIYLGIIPAGSSIVVVSSYHMDEETENWAQSDTMNFDIETYIEENQPPVADAGGPYSVMVGEELTFDGTGSSDDGTIESFAWDWGVAVPLGTGETPTFTYSEPGVYTVTLTVTDKGGLTDSDTTTVNVKRKSIPIPSRPNAKPKADAGPNQKSWTNMTVYFNGSKSRDPDGTIESYEWNFGDGTTDSGVAVEHNYSAPGQYTVTLTVRDNRWAEDSDTCKVKVSEPPTTVSAEFAERVQGGKKNHVVEAFEEANTTVTLNTTDPVTVTVLRYEYNPYPEDPIPASALPTYVDVEVSDPDAVVWPIYVEMFYTDEEVEGLDESTFGIYYWDGAWQRCSYTGVNTYTNVVWAYMTAEEAAGSPIVIAGMHAIPTPPLPPFFSYLKITPEEIEVGDNVTISFVIRNADSQHITYGVDIHIEDVSDPPPTWPPPPGQWLRIWVELEAYELKMVSHTITPDTSGVFNVTVAGMTGSFKVGTWPPEPPLRPAEFVVSELSITPEEVDIGEEVEISFTVTNVGELPGDYAFTIGIEGPLLVLSKEMTGSLEAGESEVASFKLTEDVPGTYSVEVDGLKDSFEVKIIPSAGFVLSDLTITPEEIELGEEVTVSFVIRNADSRSFVYVPYVQIGETMIMDGVELEGHESRTVSHTITPESVGDYEVEVDGLEGSFTVKSPEPPLSPGYVAGIIIVIIAAATILYFGWKGKLPEMYPESE